MKQYIRNIVLLMAAVLMVSCGKDYKDDIDKLNATHTSIEGRVSKLETQMATINSQLPQIAALASAVEQGFYITQVKTTSDGYELTLSNGSVIVLQNTPDGKLVNMPAISMTTINGFYFWTLNGVLLTDADGKPIRATGPTPVVRFDFTLNQWVISVDGGMTFKNINEYISIVINDTVLLQVINNYVRQHSTTAISQTVLFQIISTYIQEHYKELFNIELLDQVVATYIREHYTRIFSYELLEKIFTQYNFEYVKENIKVEELTQVIIQFIKEHKEVFVNNEVLYAIITNYIEVNKTTIFSNELLIQVINDFLENNENFIDVDLLTQIVNNYIDQHTDVIFNTETVRTLLTMYVEKWYVQIFSQDILIRILNTYITTHTETIFNRTIIEEVINNYIKNNSTTIITQTQLVEIINNYLKVNTTTVFNFDVLVSIVYEYFVKHYDTYIQRVDIEKAINTYLSKHETTIISVEIISEIVNNFLVNYYREVFSVDLLKTVIIDYFRQHKEVITQEYSVGQAPIIDVKVDGDVCTVTLSDGTTIQLLIYGEGSVLSKCVQSLVILPNSEGRIDEGASQLRYLVSPANMANIIATDSNIEIEQVTTDGEGSIDRTTLSGASANANGILTVSVSTGAAKAIALHIKDKRSVGTDIMTEFTPIGAEKQHGLLECPDDHHPHMIDLGLPSGTLWACCNVGASRPEDHGGYYAWGETWTKDTYSFESYNYGNGNFNFQDIGSDIAGTSYDVATVKWKSPWRMPTAEQCKELVENCTSQRLLVAFIGGSGGQEVYYVITGPSGGSIKLPAIGYMSGANNYDPYNAYYWTSTLGAYNSSSYYLRCSEYNNEQSGTTYSYFEVIDDAHRVRYYGHPVRPVAKP